MSEAPSITCPQCGMTSYNPNDIAHRYCGNCHQWHDQMILTEERFRARFDADRRAGRLTWVYGDGELGIAVGLKGPLIVLHGDFYIALARARIIPAVPPDDTP